MKSYIIALMMACWVSTSSAATAPGVAPPPPGGVSRPKTTLVPADSPLPQYRLVPSSPQVTEPQPLKIPATKQPESRYKPKDHYQPLTSDNPFLAPKK